MGGGNRLTFRRPIASSTPSSRERFVVEPERGEGHGARMTAIEEPTPVGRNEWERLIRRARLPLATKAIGYTLAQYATAKTGADAHPGVARLARVCCVDEKTVKRHLTALREAGFLVRKQEDKWRRRVALGIADDYQLTAPADYLDRPDYLDPNEQEPS